MRGKNRCVVIRDVPHRLREHPGNAARAERRATRYPSIGGTLRRSSDFPDNEAGRRANVAERLHSLQAQKRPDVARLATGGHVLVRHWNGNCDGLSTFSLRRGLGRLPFS